VNSIRRHLAYLDFLYNCLNLAEEDALRLARLDNPKPHTFPQNYKDERLAGLKCETIFTSNNNFASIHLSEYFYQGYRSIPSDTAKLIICEHLTQRHELEGMPGFYLSGGRWRLNLYGKGILRPYRDEKKRIVGFFIYRTPYQSPYLLSSAEFYKGTPAIQPLGQEEREVA
jgi:hypothetical protein